MSKGQLARPVPPWGEADELGRLAVIFEEMRRSLRDRLRSTESINVDLEREVRRRTEALEQRNARAARTRLRSCDGRRITWFAVRNWRPWAGWLRESHTKSTIRSTP